MKYKIGDKVRVRSDLKLDEIYGGKRFTSGMGMQKGCILTIKSICDNAYLTEYDTYEHLWTDEMFENINKNMYIMVAEEYHITDMFDEVINEI